VPSSKTEKKERRKKKETGTKKERTYCNPINPSCNPQAPASHAGTTGIAIDVPTSNSCSAVFALEMAVGLTSAEGSEKSQYRAMVLGGGSETQR
jgi:hypothetical protein